jgi:guanylate kinase
MKENKFLLILMGLSGCGKDSILRKLNPLFKTLISHTTRPKRYGEVNDVNYHFVTLEEFEEMDSNGEMLEKRIYNTIENGQPTVWKYGLHQSVFNQDAIDYITILDLKGSQELVKNLPSNILPYIVYVDVDDSIRKERASKRGGYEEAEFERREIADKKDFEGYEDYIDLCVENNGLIADTCLEILNLYAEWRKQYR